MTITSVRRINTVIIFNIWFNKFIFPISQIIFQRIFWIDSLFIYLMLKNILFFIEWFIWELFVWLYTLSFDSWGLIWIDQVVFLGICMHQLQKLIMEIFKFLNWFAIIYYCFIFVSYTIILFKFFWLLILLMFLWILICV